MILSKKSIGFPRESRARAFKTFAPKTEKTRLNADTAVSTNKPYGIYELAFRRRHYDNYFNRDDLRDFYWVPDDGDENASTSIKASV